MHLKYKIPEISEAENSNFIPNLILGIMVFLTVLFGIIGWFVRKRYLLLNDLVNRELGSLNRRNE